MSLNVISQNVVSQTMKTAAGVAKWDLVVILKDVDEETGATTVFRNRYRYTTLERLVDAIKYDLLGFPHDSEVFYDGVQVGALDRMSLYRIARGAEEERTLDEIEAANAA